MDERSERARPAKYQWTLGRVVAGILILGAGTAVIGFIGRREIGQIRDGLAADAAYARLVEKAERDLLAEFNVDDLVIPRRRIAHGGPPKGGIPALTNPETVSISQADHLIDEDRVIGVSLGGQARAYPVRALLYHEAVNDEVGGVPIAAVYCPLCDSVTVVDRRLEGRTYEFGISGLLLNSNVLLFDRTDHALWSQLGLTAISGPNVGRSLPHLPWELTTLSEWRQAHPDSTVMTFNTGYVRDYGRIPYGDYFRTSRLIFPVGHEDSRLHPKAAVVGVKLGDVVRAYPVDEVRKAADGLVRDTIEGQTVVLRTAPRTGSVRVMEAPPRAKIAHTFWFAWAAFHPQTEIYTGSELE
jgi:hypothetical protein